MAAMAVHHHFLSKYNKEKEGKTYQVEFQVRGEVVLFQFAKKMVVLVEKMEET